jgi:hypothetical protein
MCPYTVFASLLCGLLSPSTTFPPCSLNFLCSSTSSRGRFEQTSPSSNSMEQESPVRDEILPGNLGGQKKSQRGGLRSTGSRRRRKTRGSIEGGSWIMVRRTGCGVMCGVVGRSQAGALVAALLVLRARTHRLFV